MGAQKQILRTNDKTKKLSLFPFEFNFHSYKLSSPEMRLTAKPQQLLKSFVVNNRWCFWWYEYQISSVWPLINERNSKTVYLFKLLSKLFELWHLLLLVNLKFIRHINILSRINFLFYDASSDVLQYLQKNFIKR